MTLPASGRADVARRAFSAERLSIGLTPPLLHSGQTVAAFNEQFGDPDTQRARYSMWRAAVDRVAPPGFRAFGVSMRLDLDANRDAPPTALPLGYATGRNALIDILRDMRAAGTHHVAPNPGSDRPVREVIEEIAEHVLPVLHGDQG